MERLYQNQLHEELVNSIQMIHDEEILRDILEYTQKLVIHPQEKPSPLNAYHVFIKEIRLAKEDNETFRFPRR